MGSGSLVTQASILEPAVVATVPVGSGPWGVAITPDSQRAFIGVSGVAGGGDNVAVIDLGTRAVIRYVATSEGTSAGVAITPNGEFAFVANFTLSGTVSRINTTSFSVDEPPRVCGGPLSIAASPDNQFVYVACEFGQTWSIPVSDLSTFPALVASQTGGTFDVAVNATQQVYVGGAPGGGGRVGIAGDVTNFGTLTSRGTAVALSPDGKTAYVGDTGGRFYVFDLTATPWNTVVAMYSLGGDIRGIAITPDGQQAYVTDRNGNTVRVVDLSDGAVLYTIPVGSSPQRVAISADGLTAVVTNNASSSISIIAIPARPASGEPGSVPVAPLQQFAITDDGSCEQVPNDFTEFPGLSDALLHSRWGKSWAQWPNGGQGGLVCTRQPFYTSIGTWSVQ
jgi:YVTN family beta-propeller protein